MSTAVHELVLAPFAVAFALLHLRAALGTARALTEFAALTAYGYLLETVAIGVFRSHEYGEGWGAAPGGVPLAVAAVWAAVIVAALSLASRRAGRPALLALRAALFGITLDLAMEPVAVRLGLWRWTPPGAWLGVPLGNFVGWAVIVGAWSWGAQRWPGAAQPWRAAGERALLAAGCIGVLVVVGLAWRALDVEAVLTHGTGWMLVASVLTALLASVRAGGDRVPAHSSLTERLGARTGAPAAVFLLLAAGFAADAWLIGEASIVALTLAVACALTAAMRIGRASSG